MLQKLNERIQGAIAWIVIVLIALTFTLFGLDYYMQSRQTSDSEVEVNGQSIPKQAFDVSYRRSRQQHDLSQMTPASESALKKQVLTNMINKEISVQAARTAGFKVSVGQANTAILNIPQFQQDGRFSQERYQQALNGAMFTPESFQSEVRQGMLLNQQRFAFMGTAFALPGEVERFVKLYMQTRDYDYLEIPSANFIKKADISEEAINNYYRGQQKEFLAAEQVSIRYVLLSIQQLKNKIVIGPDEIQQYYEDNKSSFRSPAQWQVAHIFFAVPKEAGNETRQQIKQKALEVYQTLQSDPTQFDELLKTKSDDKLSLKNGGVLPWITAGQSSLDKALAGLTTAGEITEPVESPQGYEIFKLIAYKPAVLKPLAEVQSQIKEQLLAERAQAQYAQALEQLGDLSYQSPDSLIPVADRLKLAIQESGLFSRQGGDTELTKNKQVINAAFSHDVLVLGNNSEPIQLDNDSVVVLRANKHRPAAEKPLAEVKDYIAEKLAMQEAEKQAKQLGERLLASRENKNQEAALMQMNHLQWHEGNKVARDSDQIESSINDLAFSLPGVNHCKGSPLTNGNYAVVCLKKINDGELDSLDKEQQASLAQQIESSYGVMDYNLYINEWVAKAKISKPRS